MLPSALMDMASLLIVPPALTAKLATSLIEPPPPEPPVAKTWARFAGLTGPVGPEGPALPFVPLGAPSNMVGPICRSSSVGLRAVPTLTKYCPREEGGVGVSLPTLAG